jgi:tetratricopeptide (TPR) repeat protein
MKNPIKREQSKLVCYAERKNFRLNGKRILTIVALMCAVTFQMDAQDNVEQALKQAEQKVKLADKNPKNGKMQYEAAMAFINNELGEQKDFDRALTYANRALKIAREHPAPQDTLQGLTCMGLGMIYMGKGEYENATDFMEMAMDAFEVELGRNDPVTNGTKLAYGVMMMGPQPVRGFTKIQEAMFDNSFAPKDKRIENMEEANIVLETALELLIADQTKRFRYALPFITIDGKRYFIVQTADWNMERPLVGWQVQSLLRSDEEHETFKGDETIICDDNLQFTVLSDEEKEKRQMTFNFRHRILNPRHLESDEGDARIWFLTPAAYNNLLAKYRDYKKNK